MLAAHAVWDYVNTHPSRPRPETWLDQYAKWQDRLSRWLIPYLDHVCSLDRSQPR
jgi:hypothetical protein